MTHKLRTFRLSPPNKAGLLFACLISVVTSPAQARDAVALDQPDSGPPRTSPTRPVPVRDRLPLDAPAQPAVDLAVPGKVTVTILPPEAVADGASWALDGGVAQSSGSLQDGVTPGHHTVRFGDLPAWREAGPMDVLVIGSELKQVTATFTRLPRFDFQSIPQQQVRQDETVDFFVGTEQAGAQLQLTAQPQPVGPISFEVATGHFSYSPAPADRLPFSITFTTASGESGTTTITPLPVLPAEERVLNYRRALPDEESRDYMTISETKYPSEVFNDFQRETLSVSISGKTLIFAGGHPANLLPQYNQRKEIKEFNLYADRVIIRSPLILPQTHVSIHARELRFEGDGRIETTPMPRSKVPDGVVPGDNRTSGINGDPGHNGGDVDVLVERFHADPSAGPRFVLRGGAGGAAGNGRDGLPELLAAPTFPSAEWNALMSRCGNTICGFTEKGQIVIYSEDRVPNVPVDICGIKGVAHGEPAVPSGNPGRGGDGGVLRSTANLNVNGLADLAGGATGAKAGDHIGGTLSRVYGYLFTKTTIIKGEDVQTSSFQAATRVRGLDMAAPAGRNGDNGRVELIHDPASWLHSFGLRSIIQFANDAYLNGHELEARDLLNEYGELVRALPAEPDPNTELSDEALAELANLNQELLQINTIVHRIDSNLDYFGNPAGWVPMLSFEANLAAFQTEIDQSIPILYLAFWLSHAVTNLQQSLDASIVAHEKLETELDTMLAQYNQAQLDIPRLKTQAQTIQFNIQVLQSRLAELQQQLEQRAEQNVEDRHKLPFWKKALGTLSVVADLVPVGQPVVGKIGAGLGLLSQIDPDKPLESAKAIAPKAFDAFSNKDIRICFNSSVTNGTNAAKPKQDKQKQLAECAKFLGGELKELAGVFKDAQVDKNEVAAELEKLKASDPVFNEITQQLEELNAQKEQFAQQLAAALQAVATLTGAMDENVLTTDRLEDQISGALAALDHNALLHIQEMEERAKERLLKFQYYVAKAFQYRTLQPFSGNFQLNRLFDRFKILIQAGSSHVLTQDEFNQLKSLYVAELREIVGQTFDLLNSNAPERSVPISFRLSSEELQQLNSAGQITINLQKRALFPAGRQDIRIADLSTSKLAVHLTGGNVGTHALLFLDFQHLGISRLTAGGQTFLFRHQRTDSVNPITWTTVYDGLADKVSNSEPSPAAQSLVAALLNQPTSENLLLFSRPAAAADLKLTKQVLTDNGVGIVIDDLQIQVQFESSQSSVALPALEVVASEDLDPVITLSRPDLNGRQDGRGDFTRIFPLNTAVTLEAPFQFGERPFDRWVLNGQAQPVGKATLALALTSNARAEARFAAVSTSSHAAPTSSQPQNSAAAPGLKVHTSALASGSNRLINAALTVSRPATRAGKVSFEFPTRADVQYVVEVASDLDEPDWTVVETVTGTGELMRFTNAHNAASGFFRVRANPGSGAK